MKRIIIIGLIGLLITGSCKKECKIDKPKELKPIDWGNYNDVYTIFWNNTKICDSSPIQTGKRVQVCGYLFGNDLNGMNLKDSSFYDTYSPTVFIGINYDIKSDIQQRLDSCDRSRKCYITGEIWLPCLHANGGCQYTAVTVQLYNVNDMYFEEERRKI